jgi:ATP-dependent DNA helicase RecQ
MSHSALEIARKSGWDDTILDIETRVTSAIAALEDAGYVKRGQNMPRVFANSILARNAQEAIDKINASDRFEEKQKENAIRVIKKLLSSKSRKQTNDEEAESRVDYISDHLGIAKRDVIEIINLLRSERILADAMDLTAFVKRGENKNRSLTILETYMGIEHFLVSKLDKPENDFHIKKLNEEAESSGCKGVSPAKIKTLFNFWGIKQWVKRQHSSYSQNHIAVTLLRSKQDLEENLRKRYILAKRIVEYLFDKSSSEAAIQRENREEILVEFSVHEIKKVYEGRAELFDPKITIDDVENALFYLSRIEAIKIEGGFLILYNALSIERIEKDNYKKYTKADYQKLHQYYENKVAQIHIIGEYAKKMMNDHKVALQFVDDYFQLNYDSFLRKHFPGKNAETLSLKMTPAKFRQLFGELSPAQLSIINDKDSKYILVAAGPGSGKTKLLVHKLASLLLMEDVRHEQLLMVTFSRAAASEFKYRLLKLVGNAANYVEIKTFHSYCFDLLGKVGSLEKSDDIIKATIEAIRKGEVESSHITKMVLVIDEAQDMDADEYALINLLMELNEDMRVIAVGDDDQNIYEFRGSSAKYLEQFVAERQAERYELVVNYRSKSNLVEFANQFAKGISHRLKSTPIMPATQDNGKIKLVNHLGANMIRPLVEDLLHSELTGTTCVLTRLNEEASQIAGLLSRRGLTAKLIQSNDGFNLFNLLEIRSLFDQLQKSGDTFIISEEVWEQEKRALKARFQTSTKLELCLNLIRDFETANPSKKYHSDLEVFIKESKLEDFIRANGETIFVATIHKAKGKEFDNVFLMLNGYNAASDEEKRQLYVGITRAKRSLAIHTNTGAFNHIVAEDTVVVKDTVVYMPPDELAMHLTYKDVVLDYFISRQSIVSRLACGDQLIIQEDLCLTAEGQPVLKFSQQFRGLIENRKVHGYRLASAKVNFIVYWKKAGSEQETKIVLPEVWFERAVGG